MMNFFANLLRLSPKFISLYVYDSGPCFLAFYHPEAHCSFWRSPSVSCHTDPLQTLLQTADYFLKTNRIISHSSLLSFT